MRTFSLLSVLAVLASVPFSVNAATTTALSTYVSTILNQGTDLSLTLHHEFKSGKKAGDGTFYGTSDAGGSCLLPTRTDLVRGDYILV